MLGDSREECASVRQCASLQPFRRNCCKAAGISASVLKACTPGTGLRCKTGALPPAHSATVAGNLARNSVKPSATWLGFMHPLKLKATMLLRKAPAASTKSYSGVCAPSDTQRQLSSASTASAISKPKLCGSPGKVDSSTRGLSALSDSGMLAIAARSTV